VQALSVLADGRLAAEWETVRSRLALTAGAGGTGRWPAVSALALSPQLAFRWRDADRAGFDWGFPV